MIRAMLEVPLLALADSDAISPIVYLTLVLTLGVAAQWLAWRFKAPSILLLLAFGFGLGHLTGVRIDHYLAEGDGHSSPLLSAIGLFVAIILFEGGLTLKFRELKVSGLPVLRLCTISVAISFAITTLFMWKGLGYDIRLSALVGAILTVTGPTVIAPLLQHVNPTRKIAAIIKWEGIVVDPIGAILAVLVYKAALASDADAAWTAAGIAIAKVVVVGCLGGFVLAKIVEVLLRRHWIPDYLQPVFLLAVVAAVFTSSNLFEKEAGLVTVTVLGIALANQRSVSVKHILEFKENLRTLIISSLFIVLSGRLTMDDLSQVWWKGSLLLAFIILIARPLSVHGSLIASKRTTPAERTFLAFLAPRGIVAAAVASIFALEFESAATSGDYFGADAALIASQATELSALIFLIIIGTVAIYGLGAVPLARRLGLSSRNPTGILFAGANAWARLAAKALQDDGHQVMLLDTNYANVSAAKLLGLEAHRANILSEFAEEELDFNGLGSLIAGTPNDEVNSLATQRFIHEFGRAGVWQIAPADRDAHERTSAAADVRSQICFTGAPGHSSLEAMASGEAVVKKTQLTEVFSFEDFIETYRNTTYVILFVSSPNRGLRPAPAELKAAHSGTTLYYLIDPEEVPIETPKAAQE